jgi:hypothetical protein
VLLYKINALALKRLISRLARFLVCAGAALPSLILLGRPASAAGGGSGGEALLHALGLGLLLLGAALTFAYAFGLLSPPAPRPRRPAERPDAEDPLLPRPPSSLFPPSHHEKIHDAKYLRRMLEAEERRRRSTRRGPGNDTTPSDPHNPSA